MIDAKTRTMIVNVIKFKYQDPRHKKAMDTDFKAGGLALLAQQLVAAKNLVKVHPSIRRWLIDEPADVKRAISEATGLVDGMN